MFTTRAGAATAPVGRADRRWESERDACDRVKLLRSYYSHGLRLLAIVFMRNSRGRPNALTLSCKSRPTRRPLESGATAAATNTKWQERTAAVVTRACSSKPPQAASPPSQGSAVFVSL